MHIKYRDNEFTLHSRDDRVLDTLKVFSDGLCDAVQGGVSQRMLQERAHTEASQQSSYWPWSYTKSCLDYSVKGITNLVGKTLLPRD